MLEKLDRVSYLYDIYGNLLTEKQRNAIQLYYFDNFSLGEIADKYQISRQAVFDLLKRSLSGLETLEDTMKLFARYNFRKNLLKEASNIISDDNNGKNPDIQRLKIVLQDLIDENEAC